MHKRKLHIKSVLNLLLGKVGIVSLLILVQIAVLVVFILRLVEHFTVLYMLFEILSLCLVIFLVSKDENPSYKLAWVVIIMAFPIFGGLFYLTFGNKGLPKSLLLKIQGAEDYARHHLQYDLPSHPQLSAQCPQYSVLSDYITLTTGTPVWEPTQAEYFPLGEAAWERMLEELEKAERYIFMEYFIVDEGEMWGRVLEILAKKAAEGVDVRVMYDGTCEFSLLPRNYPKKLKALGIRCKVFAHVSPFVSTHYNYRDHRKILVIDGHTAFNGGVNLADEYINKKSRFGHWKDTAVMLQGEAVKSFTLMFLQMWGIDEKELGTAQFLSYPAQPVEAAKGYVIPYGDCPLDNDKLGERVYMDILNRALSYVHIMTPYLILDGELETALKFAAERGVDVALILPGIPDKAIPYALAKTHYASLLESGVKIYEYTPGFVHAKVFVSDLREAVVGTINLDYRSLYHHFECATYLYGTDCIADIEADFQATLAKCRRVSKETIRKEKWRVKLLGRLMKVIAPLL